MWNGNLIIFYNKHTYVVFEIILYLKREIKERTLTYVNWYNLLFRLIIFWNVYLMETVQNV